jgi:hypothetical protein
MVVCLMYHGFYQKKLFSAWGCKSHFFYLTSAILRGTVSVIFTLCPHILAVGDVDFGTWSSWKY